MNFIFGGAYQGKLDFAKSVYGYPDSEVFSCSGCEIDFSKPCINHLEEFTLASVKSGKDPVSYMKSHRLLWQNSTLICQDLFNGVVPLGTDLRAWRQETGLLCQYLAGEAEHVSRIFCGLEQKLK